MKDSLSQVLSVALETVREAREDIPSYCDGASTRQQDYYVDTMGMLVEAEDALEIAVGFAKKAEMNSLEAITDRYLESKITQKLEGTR